MPPTIPFKASLDPSLLWEAKFPNLELCFRATSTRVARVVRSEVQVFTRFHFVAALIADEGLVYYETLLDSGHCLKHSVALTKGFNQDPLAQTGSLE